MTVARPRPRGANRFGVRAPSPLGFAPLPPVVGEQSGLPSGLPPYPRVPPSAASVSPRSEYSATSASSARGGALDGAAPVEWLEVLLPHLQRDQDLASRLVAERAAAASPSHHHPAHSSHGEAAEPAVELALRNTSELLRVLRLSAA